MRLVIHADGGCVPNPGEGRCGLIVRDERGVLVSTLSKPLGYGTSNTAEWQALIEALKYTNGEPHCSHLTILMDSRLVVEQINGRWRVKQANLKPFAVEALALRAALAARGCAVVVEWVPREQNAQADALT